MKTKMNIWGFLAAVLVGVGLACNLTGRTELPTPSVTTPSIGATPGTASATATTGPGSSAGHRIGVRQGPAGPEFFDRVTEGRFVPRGANLWRWAYLERPAEDPALIDTMFNTSDLNQLDSAEESVRAMGAMGFNVVRVWVNACWGGAPGCMDKLGGGLDPAYLANLADFLAVAKGSGVYVMLTLDDIPGNGLYRYGMDKACCATFNGFNLDFLSPEGVKASQDYYVDTIQGLAKAGAPMDAIWAYELRNEAFFEAQLAPLSRTSGSVITANGASYDMADEASRRAMMEDGWVYWIDQITQAIKAKDPTALVTMGFFVQNEPLPIHPDDPRLVYLHRVLYDSALDFVDLHAYPGYDLSMQQHAQNFDLLDYDVKPVVMGEYGADRHNFPSISDAAAALQAWQAESCDYGFDGWLMWTWGGGEVQDDYWTAEEQGGVLAKALSPARNPDPCQPGPEVTEHPNLAIFKDVTASQSEDFAHNPGNVVDLSMGSWWSAGGGPPQWIEINLGEPQTVAGFRIPIGDVMAEGNQVHQVVVRGPGTGGANQIAYTFSGPVTHGDVLEYVPPEPLEGVQFVKIVTNTLDGWVIFHEIEVLRP
jgi:hypothetical protein